MFERFGFFQKLVPQERLREDSCARLRSDSGKTLVPDLESFAFPSMEGGSLCKQVCLSTDIQIAKRRKALQQHSKELSTLETGRAGASDVGFTSMIGAEHAVVQCPWFNAVS